MIKRIFRFFFKSLLWFIGLSVIWVLIYAFVPIPGTPLMGLRAIESGDTYETKHEWVSIDDMSPAMQLAVICSEDQNFMTHNGFDYEAIKKAYRTNLGGKRLSGGSTISQQTAKNVFLWPQRTWLRKGLETWFTFLIETFWSKERILEVYLNSIEMGEGIYGAQAAANFWFNKDAKNLTRHEAASIAAILPNPRVYKASPRSPYLEGRKQWILLQMNYYGELKLAKNETSQAKK